MPTAPPEQPRWLRRLNSHAMAAGGGEHLIPLDPLDLIDAAIASCNGLDDFGDDDWRQWFELVVQSLETESKLHLVGRLLARHDILRSLRNRLLLHDLWKRRPEILETELLQPTFVVGMARSGTSILSELLSLDDSSRCPAMWEMLHPTEAIQDDKLRQAGHDEHVFMEDTAPEYGAMHSNHGDVPNECIFMTMNTFQADQWSGLHHIPSYAKEFHRSDQRPVYQFHEKFLKTLQQRGSEGRTRWGLKAPSHLGLQEELFSVYPEALVIRIHRDPLKSLPSTFSLTNTLLRMRCEEEVLARDASGLAFGIAYMLEQELAKRGDGRIPAERVIDVKYEDLMRDLPGTIRNLYERAQWELRDEVLQRMQSYVANRPKGAHGKHEYSLEGAGLDAAEETERFRFYREAFDIPSEA